MEEEREQEPQPAELPLILGSHQSSSPDLLRPSRLMPGIEIDTSVISDLGDSEQLQQTASPHYERHISPATSIVDILGGLANPDPVCIASFGNRELGPEKSSQGVAVELVINKKLRNAMRPSAWRGQENDKFLPLDRLDELITLRSVEAEVDRLQIPGVDARAVAEAVKGKVAGKVPGRITTRRKLFVILLHLRDVRRIIDLIDEGIHDDDLPFELEIPSGEKEEVLCKKRQKGTDRLVAVNSLRTWTWDQADKCDTFQWRLLAPFFSFTDDPDPEKQRMARRTILPFISDSRPSVDSHLGLGDLQRRFVGGCSEVHKVEIHPAHYSLAGSSRASNTDNPFFAVKKLRDGTRKEDYVEEVKSLKLVMRNNHPNMIRLLGTFEIDGVYHMVFPWADADLVGFWSERYPDPVSPARDMRLAQWLASQFVGLMGGLRVIHRLDDHPTISEKLFGRHGDIKPQNILWFRGSHPDDLGILKIADLGFASWHRKESEKLLASLTSRSPTYRAPELDSKRDTGIVDGKSDIWSMGCVILECVVWYCNGWEGLQTFSDSRNECRYSPSDPKEDTFFIPMAQYLVRDPLFGIRRTNTFDAQVKASVQNKIQELRKHERCGPFFTDILNYIETHMLKIKADLRPDSESVLAAFERMCGSSHKPPGYWVKNAPTWRDDDDAALVAAQSQPTSHDVGESYPRWRTGRLPQNSIPSAMSSGGGSFAEDVNMSRNSSWQPPGFNMGESTLCEEEPLSLLLPPLPLSTPEKQACYDEAVNATPSELTTSPPPVAVPTAATAAPGVVLGDGSPKAGASTKRKAWEDADLEPAAAAYGSGKKRPRGEDQAAAA